MKIACELVEISDINRENPSGLSKGRYLSVVTDREQKPVYIPYDDFVSTVAAARHELDVSLGEPVAATEPDLPAESLKDGEPNLDEAVRFLSNKINITDGDFEKSDELIVQSDLPDFLELPWEDVVNTKIYVFRHFAGNSIDGTEEGENNLLVFMSHSHEDVGDDLKKVMNEEVRAIYNAVHYFVENNQSYFRIDRILLSKHTTKKVLYEIDWDAYNFAHFVMHGHNNGGLCLEKPDRERYKEVDLLSAAEFLEVLEGHYLALVFLSICYSGGSSNYGGNLAFQIVKAGVSRHVVAYRNRVGEDSAKDFAEIFYKNLSNGGRITDVYKNSLKNYYGSGSKHYTPLLYVNV